MKYKVTLLKGFSTTVDIEADSIEEARENAYEQEPNDSIIGFAWEPDGESEVYAVYDENDEEVWSAWKEVDVTDG